MASESPHGPRPSETAGNVPTGPHQQGHTWGDVFLLAARNPAAWAGATVVLALLAAGIVVGWVRIDVGGIAIARPGRAPSQTLPSQPAPPLGDPVVFQRLEGHWKGQAADTPYVGDRNVLNYTYAIEIEFARVDGSVRMSGTYTFDSEDPNRPGRKQVVFRKVSGPVDFNGEWVRVAYEIEDAAQRSRTFGAMLLQLDQKGGMLTGRFMSRSMQDNELINGTIELTR